MYPTYLLPTVDALESWDSATLSAVQVCGLNSHLCLEFYSFPANNNALLFRFFWIEASKLATSLNSMKILSFCRTSFEDST